MSGPFDRRHGWDLYQHPAFRDVFDRLVADVAAIAAKDSKAAEHHPKARLLRRVTDLVLDQIPRDPGSPEFRQGRTLGEPYRHWRRARFHGRFRLFFRYSSRHRVIVYTWLNDETTLRRSGARTDPYAIFAHRLKVGNPPDDWEQLVREASR